MKVKQILDDMVENGHLVYLPDSNYYALNELGEI